MFPLAGSSESPFSIDLVQLHAFCTNVPHAQAFLSFGSEDSYKFYRENFVSQLLRHLCKNFAQPTTEENCSLPRMIFPIPPPIVLTG